MSVSPITTSGDEFPPEMQPIEPATCCDKIIAVSVAIFSGMGFVATALYSGYNFYCASVGDEHYQARIVLGVMSGAASLTLGALSIYSIKIANRSFTRTYII